MKNGSRAEGALGFFCFTEKELGKLFISRKRKIDSPFVETLMGEVHGVEDSCCFCPVLNIRYFAEFFVC